MYRKSKECGEKLERGGRVLLTGRAAGFSPPSCCLTVQSPLRYLYLVLVAGGESKAEDTTKTKANPVAGAVGGKNGAGKKLTGEEQRAKGRVKARVYWAYIAAAGGVISLLSVLASFAGVEALRFFQNDALGLWVQKIEDEGHDDSSNRAAMMTYLLYSLGVLAVIAARILCVSISAMRASRKIHDAMCQRVMRAPLSFFQRTPMGRILNRFSSDIETIDQDIMDTTRDRKSVV